MLSPHLKKVIEDSGALLVNDDQDTLISLPGQYKNRYTCSCKIGSDARVRLQAWSIAHLIVDAEKIKRLCAAIKPSFGSNVEIGFQPETGRFCISTYSPQEVLSENLTILTAACNYVFPLFYEVARGKECDTSLLLLAGADTESMARM